ncbi:MAG: glycosyltransferase family 4 protein [Bacteroidia bacterium]|nr:glycosyltransferase family 4 protein [Bacteroidia bacterium]
MKIALIHYRMLLKGGLETRLFSYIDYLIREGHEVTVIISKLSREIEIPKGITLVKARHWRFPKRKSHLYFDRWLGRYMAQEKFDFSLSLGRTSHQDVVLAPGNHPGYLAAIGKTDLNAKDKIEIALDESAYQHSRFILAASQMMKREVMQYFGVEESRVQVLYPPADINRFHGGLKERKAEFQQKYGLDPAKRSFLFVSTGHKRKGLPLLLEIFAQLQNEPVELIIAGDPPVRSGLPNVKFLGFVRETQELYAAAAATIHPSVYEPYGQIVAESILCGTPVLVSTRVGAAEIVSAKEGLVLDNLEPENWLRAVRDFRVEQFTIDPDFARLKGLRLEDHMQQILSLAERLRG